MREIRKRKEKLKDDLELLESGFESRISKVNSMIPGNLNPVKTIQKHPLKAVGISVFFGVLAGMATGSGKKKGRSTEGKTSDRPSSQGFGSMVFNELKRVAAYRTASYLSELIENSMSGKNEARKK